MNRISARELSEWLAFSRIEPFGDRRADLRTGIIASTIANVNIDPKKSKPFSPTDFMPDYDSDLTEKPAQSPDEQLSIVEYLNAAFGGRDLRKK